MYSNFSIPRGEYALMAFEDALNIELDMELSMIDPEEYLFEPDENDLLGLINQKSCSTSRRSDTYRRFCSKPLKEYR